MGVAHDMVAALAHALAHAGTPGTFRRHKDGAEASGLPVRFLLKHAGGVQQSGVRDEGIVNAYGINALVITLPHSPAFAQRPPEKFDLILQDLDAADPLPYVFDAVVRREVEGVVVAWTAYVKGKGS